MSDDRGVRPVRAARVLLAAVALVAVACGPDPGTTNPTGVVSTWSAFRYDATGIGAQPNETAVGLLQVARLTQIETGLTGGAVDSSPAVVGGVAYVGSADGQLRAFATPPTGSCAAVPVDCAPLWTATVGGSVTSSPAVAGGVVYIGGPTGVVAFDAAGSKGCSGTPKVCTPLFQDATASAVRSSPTVAGTTIYVVDGNGGLSAFDATGSTGCSGTPKVCTALWSASTGTAPTGLGSSPIVAGGDVYVGSGNGTLQVFDAAGVSGCSGLPTTCVPRWTGAAASGSAGASASTPAVVNGIVYLAAGSGLGAFDAAGVTGCSGTPKVCQARWTDHLPGASPSSLAVAGGLVYVEDAGVLSAFDAAGLQDCLGTPVSCTVVWSAPTGPSTATYVPSPSVANGIVYVGSSDDNLYAFDAAGFTHCTGFPRSCLPLWSGLTGGPIDSSAAVVSGEVYVGSADHRLYSFGSCTNPESGAGVGPCDITTAYRLPAYGGSPTATVAIVDAYDDPSLESDLAVYRSTYHLPPCTIASGCLTKLNQRGQTTNLPASNKGWAVEESLDVQMVSATCPRCHIILAEADDDSFDNAAIAQDMLAALHPTAISDSFGTEDWSDETQYDADFDHPGIPTVVASGDTGYGGGPQYPASIPDVVAVGGTTLSLSSQWWRAADEAVWDEGPAAPDSTAAGSGCALVHAKPAWQTDAGCANRTIADVAADAGPTAVYDTTGYGGWLQVQGTSAATPIIASLYALAGSASTVQNIYAHASSLYDVIQGQNTVTCTQGYLCKGVAGYDGPTGLGTPCGLIAFGGASPLGCGGTASVSFGSSVSPSAGIAGRTSTPLTPACAKAPPGHVRCLAWVARRSR